METRAFKNPYPDYDGNPMSTQSLFDSQGKRIRGKVCQLLEVMEEGLKSANPRDCTSYTGWTGIALLYLHLHDVFGDASFLARALEAVGRNLQGLTRRHDVTFLCGDAGPLAVAAAVYYRMQRPHETEECLHRLLQLHAGVVAGSGGLPDELLYGRVGYLYALVFINQQLGHNHIPLQYIQQPGFVAGEERVHGLVRPSVDYVSRLHSPAGNYPACLGEEGHLLVHWCHGAPGVVYMLLQAYRVFGEAQYLCAAVQCGEVVWRWGLLKKGYGLCHGAAGNAYTFLALYRLTLDAKHLYRACMPMKSKFPAFEV
ncbi:hypothetical protein CRUP_024138 [Coryphaenoides rupestris]|nr:hypothetical protein CRUP_024138 [Coryphaenoides rupestris]